MEVGHARKNGYRHVCLQGKHYYAHRIIWLLSYGEWPTGQVDHINGDRSDNRISNLRDVSPLENLHNTKVKRKNNSSGHHGVYKFQNKWATQIRVPGGKRVWLGLHGTPEDAAAAYETARMQYHHGYVPA